MATTITGSCHQQCRASTCPAWLQAALSDIDQRVQSLSLNRPEKEMPDSFGERAENYYQKRPQLLSLLHDLHNRYLYLADRYAQSLLPKNPIRCRSVSSDIDVDSVSDAESSLSYQPAPHEADAVAVALVAALVEREVLADLASEGERRQREWSKKVELQRSLVEVLESERVVLAAENARLAFRASAAEEEARGLAAEVGYVRRKAGELARYVGRMREERRACELGRRIEGLERQVIGLRRRDREWFEAMARREGEEGEVRKEVERLREENRRLMWARRRVEDGAKGWWAHAKGKIMNGWCFTDPCCSCFKL